MTFHALKTWPEYFAAVVDGRKTFEVRKDDRGFEVGDTVDLHEYVPGGTFTGRHEQREITYVARGAPFLPDGLCVFGLTRSRSQDIAIAASTLALDPNGVVRALEAGIRARAVQDFTTQIDGYKSRCIDAESTLDEARETICAAQETIASLTDRVAEATSLLGQGGAPSVALVGTTAAGLSPDSAAGVPSIEALRVAAAVALVALDKLLAVSTTTVPVLPHEQELLDAAGGLRTALAVPDEDHTNETAKRIAAGGA